jgi:hypothetical protein
MNFARQCQRAPRPQAHIDAIGRFSGLPKDHLHCGLLNRLFDAHEAAGVERQRP